MSNDLEKRFDADQQRAYLKHRATIGARLSRGTGGECAEMYAFEQGALWGVRWVAEQANSRLPARNEPVTLSMPAGRAKVRR